MEKNFENIRKTAKETFDEIKKDSEEVSTRLCENGKKAADYQASYDALMNEKRVRTLSTAENKRLRILKSNIDYYKNLRDAEFDDIKTKLELKEISEQEYYDELSRLRNIYFEKGSADWNEYTVQIIKHNQEVVESQQKEIEEMLSGVEEEYSKSYENILKKQGDMKEKLDDSFKVYETVYFDMGNDKKSEWLRLSNIDEDLAILKKYNNALIEAKKKINVSLDELGIDDKKALEASSKFFEQITDLSIQEGYAFSNRIIDTDNEQLLSFMSKWVEKTDLTEAISKNLYADEGEQLLENYAVEMSERFSQALNEKFGEIPDTFFTNGERSALNFKNGFLSMIDSVLNDISVEINEKLANLMPDVNELSGVNSITNNSSYNIYGATSPDQTALEIYKQEEKKRMLIGE